MKNRIPQNYFIGSLIFHIVIFLVLAISLRDNNQKSFIVFGAHSKKTTKIVFKSPKSKNKKSVSVGSKNIKNIKKKPEKKPDKKPEKKLENKLEKKSGKKSEKKSDKKLEKKLEKIKEKSDGDDINIGKLSKKQKKQKEQEKKEQDLKEQKKREQEELEKEQEREREREEELQKKKDIERAQQLAAQEEDLLEDFDDQDDESDEQDEKDEPEEFNFLTLSDQEQAIYHKKIQQEVQKLWRPPLGAPRGTKCVVSFVVGPDGTIESFEIVKRSNMLIYDLSIQRVAMKFKFDKSLWGKKFRIDFQQ
jgi:hypothetical protein